MKTIIHKSNTRGHADHGWLNSYHSFSFGNYHNPERMNFGALRVLNDDTVAAGRGFGTHPHRNMEIISIPLEGDLQHMDNMGNSTVIKSGDVQMMSAGTGVSHSEFNKNKDKEVKFLQIWIIPNKEEVTPRYDQISIEDIATKNSLYQILSPNTDDAGVWIHQNAWFHLGEYESGITDSYDLKDKGNGVYIFVLDGEIEIANKQLGKRDGLGIWETDTFNFKTNQASKILFMEVPMVF
ncbi:pirin family protein [Maribacter sp. SA7]|uniref:pirin family protein n=1 Tax=Maribacter zhoushanensis TaxID=3030012 RepID=UPI0023ED7979|nr:pirin family protein [Maribacter zhoushanensis]MDF4204801.1 pirin family protein [Maribacter zhoushanensis]